MPWNPDLYNTFKDIRYQPFYDLLGFIQSNHPDKIVDLGCGTGEQTSIIAERFPNAAVLGVDSSPEMLQQSAAVERQNLSFRQQTIEELAASDEKWDIIFSNAALQWSDNHELLFPSLLSLLQPGGQFLVQMPMQKDNTLNRILLELAEEEPFRDYLKGWTSQSPVQSIDAYTQWLFDAGLVNLRVEQRVYPIIATDHDTLYQFIAGSALIPYMERLATEERSLFIEAYKRRIAAAFPKLPAIYAFKRLLLYGTK